jgi:N-acetylglucosamine-6-phosphate deacetylase
MSNATCGHHVGHHVGERVMSRSRSLTAVCGAAIFDGRRQWSSAHALLLAGDRIRGIVPTAELPADLPRQTVSGGLLAPGLVDLQLNGGGGVQLNEMPTASAVNAVSDAHAGAGTTAWLPTLISDHLATMERGAQAALAARIAGNTSVMGVHLEGPFLAQSRAGIHPQERLRRARRADLQRLCDLRETLAALPAALITVAPECVPVGGIRQLRQAGWHVFAGHSQASPTEIQRALDEGLSGFTHLFNAMPPLAGREPGIAGVALLDRSSWCTVIADGHHLDPLMLALALRCKPRGKVVLVSDAMALSASTQRHCQLQGAQLSRQRGALRNAEGRLAGSASTLLDGVHTLHHALGVPLHEALAAASRYPAEALGLASQVGTLRRGARANLLHLSAEGELLGVWQAGRRLPAAHTGRGQQKRRQ